MLLIFSRLLNFILPSFLYKKIKKNFYYFKNYKYRKYDLSKDLKYNEDTLKKINIDVERIKNVFKKLNIDYYDQSLSWHYQIFCGLSDYFLSKEIKVNNILEIGTFDGKFANFLSKIYPNSEITTIDLKQSDEKFKNSYSREDNNIRVKFLQKRTDYLNKSNINFIEMDSTLIKENFKSKKFEMIWVDGDHLDPQVSTDIINSLDLINSSSLICVDDVMIYEDNFIKIKNCTNESYKTLKYLEGQNKIKNLYLLKRIIKSNAQGKKYISISIKK